MLCFFLPSFADFERAAAMLTLLLPSAERRCRAAPLPALLARRSAPPARSCLCFACPLSCAFAELAGRLLLTPQTGCTFSS